jgi:wyosine [tRNA(Phe)-imidazoG37] synthetase (radical SAM superfamily)
MVPCSPAAWVDPSASICCPRSTKLCSFNCLYCQYGWTKNVTFTPGDRLKDLPSPGVVATALETALTEFSRGHKAIDAISICGNGEPTLYPALAEVNVQIKKFRDRYQPDARTAILSNSSTVGDPGVPSRSNSSILKL